MVWLVVFGFVATFLWSVANVLDKFVVSISEEGNCWGILSVSILSVFPLFVVLFFLFGVEIPGSVFVFVVYLLVGVSYFLAVYFYLRSLVVAEATSVSVLLKLSSVFILFGEVVFLGGVFSPAQIGGMFLLVLSSLVITVEALEDLKVNKAFWLMIVSGLFFAVRSLLADFIVNGNPVELYAWTIVGAILACFVLLVLNDKARSETVSILFSYSKKQVFLIGLSKNISGIGILFYIVAIDIGSVSIVSFITSTQPIFVVLLVVFVNFVLKVDGDNIDRDYSLRNTVKTLASIGLAVLGVVLISVF